MPAWGRIRAGARWCTAWRAEPRAPRPPPVHHRQPVPDDELITAVESASEPSPTGEPIPHPGAGEALRGLVAPEDPRQAWSLPAFGDLPPVERLDELTVRLLAPNPSPMTLDGTNTYVVGVPGRGSVAVIDPGPDDPSHRAAVDEVVRSADAQVAAIVVTHWHHDHAEAAERWAADLGCPVVASSRDVAGPVGSVVSDGEVVDVVAGCAIEVVATPGHTRDHLSLRLPNGALLTGDHVLGRGTSVVAHPDGDLVAYLASLRKVLSLGPDVLYPGHGPALREDPLAVLRYYRDHRRFREQQLRTVLAHGPASPGQLVAAIYADVDPWLWPAAEASTRAALHALEAQGVIEQRDDVARLCG